MEKLLTKTDLSEKLRSYAETPDDDVIRIKNKIKSVLLNSPELLYAMNDRELEAELFDTDGSLKAHYEDGRLVPDGEWNKYFGSVIFDVPLNPTAEGTSRNYLTYAVSRDEPSKENKIKYNAKISFTVLCPSSPEQARDPETGIARHDLISSVIREKFNWSDIFGAQCRLTSNRESVSETGFLTRVLTFECVLNNGILNTPRGGAPSVTNNRARE